MRFRLAWLIATIIVALLFITAGKGYPPIVPGSHPVMVMIALAGFTLSVAVFVWGFGQIRR